MDLDGNSIVTVQETNWHVNESYVMVMAGEVIVHILCSMRKHFYIGGAKFSSMDINLGTYLRLPENLGHLGHNFLLRKV